MSSLNEIYFNYNKAIAQAERLDDIAKRLTDAADVTLDGILGDVYQAWKSDSTQGYLKKGEKVEQDIRTTAKNLRDVAKAIRTIAERIMQAELEAWRIANERMQ